MGSEQSSQSGGVQKTTRTGKIGQLRRGKSVPEPKRPVVEGENVDNSRPGSCSPGLSVCSDSDLPYISYTVNRPIGDSPKLPVKQGQLVRGKSLGAAAAANSSPTRKGILRKQAPRQPHNVVVVKPAAKDDSSEKDPDIIRLQKIPMFLPIMRGTLNLPAPRDPEILERLDPNALYKLCLKCEKYLHECATAVAGDQHLLALQIKEVDTEVSKLYLDLVERQKLFSKHVDELAKISEVTTQIAKCHVTLNTTLEAVDKLNSLLPESERLEPFVWSTG